MKVKSRTVKNTAGAPFTTQTGTSMKATLSMTNDTVLGTIDTSTSISTREIGVMTRSAATANQNT